MSVLTDMIRHGGDFMRVFEEAKRLEAGHYAGQGWTKEGTKWKSPAGEVWTNKVSGPGSVSSIAHYMKPAAEKVGVDMAQWGDIMEKLGEVIEAKVGSLYGG